MADDLPSTASLPPPVPSGGNSTEWPEELKFAEKHLLAVVAYAVLLALSAPANVGVIIALLRKRKQMKRMNLMLLHLAIADLMVTCILMPMEISWAATVQWLGGDLLCRLLSFFRVFGLYLSNFVLICISIDRYRAVVRPMEMMGTANRCKRTLTAAWILSAVCSFPQVLIFRELTHPEFEHLNFTQCVDFKSFPHMALRTTYAFFTFFFMYLLPLLVIIFCYTRIVSVLTRRSAPAGADSMFRNTDSSLFVRARQRTLQMTFVIVLTFVVCWTPYYIMSVWYWVDRASAKQVHPLVQKVLFIFATANSVANPLVYGFYHSQLCQLPQMTSSSRQKSQSVELAILDTAPTCDTLLGPTTSLRPTTGRTGQGRNGVTRTALQPSQLPAGSTAADDHHAL